jgi:hypothetical protein
MGHAARAPLSRSVLWERPEGRDASSPSTAGLKNGASAGSPDCGPFVFWRGAGSQSVPVVCDWNGDGVVTPGTAWPPTPASPATRVDVLAATTTFAFGRRTR